MGETEKAPDHHASKSQVVQTLPHNHHPRIKLRRGRQNLLSAGAALTDDGDAVEEVFHLTQSSATFHPTWRPGGIAFSR